MGYQTKKNPRRVALDILNRVEGGDAYADILLDKELKKVDSALDRGFITELVYGCLRWRGRIDWIIERFSRVKTKRMEYPILNTLRLGVYQLLFMERVPPSAVVDESVKLVKTLGEKKGGFINAILRRVDRERGVIPFPEMDKDPILHISTVWSHPAWMVKRWVERYGIDETIRLCQANNQVPPQVLRVNTLKITRSRLLDRLKEEGVEATPTNLSPDGIEVISTPLPIPQLPIPTSYYYIQDEASQLIAYLLDPKPGEVILDACSAPGGKATHLAQLMGNDGIIFAMDTYPARVSLIKETARRLGATIIRPVVGDAEVPLNFAPQDGFDAILVDVPCSGLGAIRRNPDAKWRRKERDIIELSRLQKKMLDNLAHYVKIGGGLVYSTCTLEPEENEGVIEDFLERHNDFVLEDAGKILPEVCGRLVDKRGFFRTFPPRDGPVPRIKYGASSAAPDLIRPLIDSIRGRGKQGMDGFFAGRLKRCR